MRSTLGRWGVAIPILLVALPGLAGVLVLALQQGTLWAAAVSAGVLAGILLATAWALRPVEPRVAAALLGAAIVPATLVWLMSPGAGLGSLAIAAAVLAIWLLIENAARARKAATLTPSPH